MTSIEPLKTPDPHFIPGYTGYCPQYVYRLADTYSSLTHKLLLDPRINHSEQLVLSDRTHTDYQVVHPRPKDTNLVTGRDQYANSVYKHPMVPGYEGFVPKRNAQLGQTFAVEAMDGMSEFDRECMNKKKALNNLEREVEINSGKYTPSLEERESRKSPYTLPLLEVRPEYSGVLRTIPVTEYTDAPGSTGISPYFMDVLEEGKSFKTGYTGHIPFGHSKYGQGYAPFTNSALCDFTSNYRKRQSTEWVPVNVVKPDPPLIISSAELYHKHIGMLPNYGGHIPGISFRSGKTFGNDSRDAKRWLRGDQSE